MNYELLFLKALSITTAFETLVLVAFFRLIVRKHEIGIVRLLFAGFITSFATLPYLWFIFPYYVHAKTGYAFVCETFAVLVESVILYAILRTKYFISLLASFACNMISFLFGLIIM